MLNQADLLTFYRNLVHFFSLFSLPVQCAGNKGDYPRKIASINFYKIRIWLVALSPPGNGIAIHRKERSFRGRKVFIRKEAFK